MCLTFIEQHQYLKLFSSTITQYFQKPENNRFRTTLKELSLKLGDVCERTEYASNQELLPEIPQTVEPIAEPKMETNAESIGGNAQPQV